MHSYNNLWEPLLTETTLILAMKNAGKNKNKNNRRHKKLREYRNNPKQYVDFFINYIKNYEPKTHFTKEINDGISAKKRKITIPTAEEVVMHNAIIIVLKPILMKGMYEHSYACIDGKGIHDAVKQINKWIEKEDKIELTEEQKLIQLRKKNINPKYATKFLKSKKKYYSKVKYVLKLDIKQFFNSVDIKNLIERLSKIIRDKKFLNLIIKVLSSSEQGLALGYTTSHWLANWILTPIDHYIKEELKMPYYIRFVDDMVIFNSNKTKLHRAKIAIEIILQEELHLLIKSNWQIFLLSELTPSLSNKIKSIQNFKNNLNTKFAFNGNIIKIKTKEGRPLDFLGYKFYRKNLFAKTNRITLRKSIALRIKRKVKHIYKKGFANIRDARQIVTYAGMCKYANCYTWFKNNVLKYVSISRLRKQISKYDKEKIDSKVKISNLTLNLNPNLIVCP